MPNASPGETRPFFMASYLRLCGDGLARLGETHSFSPENADTTMEEMAIAIPNAEVNPNGSFQNKAPEIVGIINPMEYTIAQIDVAPRLSAIV